MCLAVQAAGTSDVSVAMRFRSIVHYVFIEVFSSSKHFLEKSVKDLSKVLTTDLSHVCTSTGHDYLFPHYCNQ